MASESARSTAGDRDDREAAGCGERAADARDDGEATGRDERKATGGCLCGSVRYEVRGPLRDILFCHCENCRRTHGNFSAYTSARREDLVITGQETLRWYHTDKDVTPNVRRGFCGQCGASVFWDPQGYEYVYISAGSVDPPTGVKGAGHIWLSEAGDYYEITDDLPRAAGSSKGLFLGTPHD